MKKLGLTLVMAMMGVMLIAGGVWALPTLPNGYEWTNAPYWSLTDTATANSNFQLVFERAAYESDFGLFVVDDMADPSVVTKVEVFDYMQEPSNYPPTCSTVTFKYDNGWKASTDNTNFINFDTTFGFYFDVHTGGATDTTVEYSYFSDSSLNTPTSETGKPHVLSAWNSDTYQAMIYLDDQLYPGDLDYEDMVVLANDVAPVPEPGTMALLGIGLLGLAFVGRKKLKIEE